MYCLVSWRNGYKEYLCKDESSYTTSKKAAGIFTGDKKDEYPHLWLEEVSEAEKMEMAGAALLPGFDA